ncbi:MAG: hypothetical protein D3916_07805 [Candidatus Electrothrix sp. MAN1_4]|nr:hypothetical protein [Candidatus Electrothrix sp. MAN1_4]
MADETKRDRMKENFSANKIPTEPHFHELIDEIALRSNGLEKLKDGPLQIATGENKHKVICMHQKLDSDAVWSLTLQSKEQKSGLSIEDKKGKSRLFIDEKTGNIGIGTDSMKNGQRLHVKGDVYVEGKLHVTDLHVTGDATRVKNKFTWDTAPAIVLPKDIDASIKKLNQALKKVTGLKNDFETIKTDFKLSLTGEIKKALDLDNLKMTLDSQARNLTNFTKKLSKLEATQKSQLNDLTDFTKKIDELKIQETALKEVKTELDGIKNNVISKDNIAKVLNDTLENKPDSMKNFINNIKTIR